MKKFLLTFLCLLTLSLTGRAETWTSAPTTAAEWDKVLEGSSGTNTSKAPTAWEATSNNLTANWTLSYNWKTDAYYSRGKNGIQLGSSSCTINSMTLKTSSFTEYNIKSVTVKGAKSNGNAKLSVTVGGVSLKYNNAVSQTLSSTATDIKFTGDGIGDIEISFAENASGKYIGLSGLEVEYTTSSGPIYPTEVAAPTFNIENGADVYPGTEVIASCVTPDANVMLAIGNQRFTEMGG